MSRLTDHTTAPSRTVDPTHSEENPVVSIDHARDQFQTLAAELDQRNVRLIIEREDEQIPLPLRSARRRRLRNAVRRRRASGRHAA